MDLAPLNEQNAPDRAAATLKQVRSKMGFIPNMLGVMAHAPAVLESYLALAGKYETVSLDPTERQLVLLAVSQRNGCDYCLAAHGTIARQQGVDEAVIAAAREGRPLDDPKLEALRRFAEAVVATDGRPGRDGLDAFLAAGYTEAQALEVVLGVAFKTLSNYTNHLTDPAIDEAFAETDAPAGSRA